MAAALGKKFHEELNAKNYDAAEATARAAMKSDPKDPLPHLFLARVLTKRAATPELGAQISLEILTQAQTLCTPKHSSVLFEVLHARGVAMHCLKRWKECIDTAAPAREALALVPPSEGRKRMLAELEVKAEAAKTALAKEPKASSAPGKAAKGKAAAAGESSEPSPRATPSSAGGGGGGGGGSGGDGSSSSSSSSEAAPPKGPCAACGAATYLSAEGSIPKADLMASNSVLAAAVKKLLADGCTHQVFLFPRAWWEAWCAHVGFDGAPATGPAPGPLQTMALLEEGTPLACPPSNCHVGPRLRPGLTHATVHHVEPRVWSILRDKYGLEGVPIMRYSCDSPSTAQEASWYPERTGLLAAAGAAAPQPALSAAPSPAGPAGLDAAPSPPTPAAPAPLPVHLCDVCALPGAVPCVCSCAFYCRPHSSNGKPPALCQKLAWDRGHKGRCKELKAMVAAGGAAALVGPLRTAAVGLENVGNTCFLGSSLQALASVWDLSRYFVRGDFVADLAPDNRLGTGGDMARSFKELAERLWFDRGFSAVAPTVFKRQLQRFQARFEGSQQHDAQELLMFVLEFLHEDCNTAAGRGRTQLRDCEPGESDASYGAAAAAHFRASNSSRVVDLFYGQFKNAMTCPACAARSIKFDPYNMLNLPMPAAEHHSVHLGLFRLQARLWESAAQALPGQDAPPAVNALWDAVADATVTEGLCVQLKLLFPIGTSSVTAEELLARVGEEAGIPACNLVLLHHKPLRDDAQAQGFPPKNLGRFSHFSSPRTPIALPLGAMHHLFVCETAPRAAFPGEAAVDAAALACPELAAYVGEAEKAAAGAGAGTAGAGAGAGAGVCGGGALPTAAAAAQAALLAEMDSKDAVTERHLALLGPRRALLAARPPAARVLVPLELWIRGDSADTKAELQLYLGETSTPPGIDKACDRSAAGGSAHSPLCLALSLPGDTPLPVLRMHAAAAILPLLGGAHAWRKCLSSMEHYKHGPFGQNLGEGIPGHVALLELAARLPLFPAYALQNPSAKKKPWLGTFPTPSMPVIKGVANCAPQLGAEAGAPAPAPPAPLQLSRLVADVWAPEDVRSAAVLNSLVHTEPLALALRGPDLYSLLRVENLGARFTMSRSLAAAAASEADAMEISTCLRQFLREEELDGTNMWRCSGCGENVSAGKTIQLWDLPEVLIINLKRYGTRLLRSGMVARKSEKKVVFPLRGLDMAPYYRGGSSAGGSAALGTCYDCIAVVNQIGGNMSSGHYTAFVNRSYRLRGRTGEEDAWYSFDDHKVAKMAPKDIVTNTAVRRFLGGGLGSSRARVCVICSSCAPLLSPSLLLHSSKPGRSTFSSMSRGRRDPPPLPIFHLS